MASPTRLPARDKCRAFLPRALAEGWSMRRLAREAGVGQQTATRALREASAQARAAMDRTLAGDVSRSVAVARRIRDGQIEQAQRIEALAERAISDLEAQAKAGGLSIRDLETLTRLRDRHWQHVKDLAGISMAEKMTLAQAKGDAAGRGLAGALIDATALDIGAGVWEIASADN